MSAGAPPAVELRGLTKRYGPHTAVDALSLTIARGTFVGLLGPNGAGKSTLFQMLTGLFVADAGQALIAGHSISDQPVKALAALGVVFQQIVARPRPVGRAQPALPCRPARPAARVSPMRASSTSCAALGLAGDRQRAVRELSGGNRRKVELVRALLHQPRCC